MKNFRYIGRVNRLTRQEIFFIGAVAGLLLTGFCVKWYRAQHPAAPPKTEAQP